MADFSALKTSIQNYIKQNGNEEITGNLLQQILLSMVTTLGDSAINNLVTALNAEIANRGNADTELSGRITTLQGVINSIKANVENGYVYAGIATPSTTPASGKVFYLALTAGTYTNFGATVVPQGINILKYNGSVWSLDRFLGLDDAPTQGSINLVKSSGVWEQLAVANGAALNTRCYNANITLDDNGNFVPITFQTSYALLADIPVSKISNIIIADGYQYEALAKRKDNGTFQRTMWKTGNFYLTPDWYTTYSILRLRVRKADGTLPDFSVLNNLLTFVIKESKEDCYNIFSRSDIAFPSSNVMTIGSGITYLLKAGILYKTLNLQGTYTFTGSSYLCYNLSTESASIKTYENLTTDDLILIAYDGVKGFCSGLLYKYFVNNHLSEIEESIAELSNRAGIVENVLYDNNFSYEVAAGTTSVNEPIFTKEYTTNSVPSKLCLKLDSISDNSTADIPIRLDLYYGSSSSDRVYRYYYKEDMGHYLDFDIPSNTIKVVIVALIRCESSASSQTIAYTGITLTLTPSEEKYALQDVYDGSTAEDNDVYSSEVQDTAAKITELSARPCLVYNIMTDSHENPQNEYSKRIVNNTLRNIQRVYNLAFADGAVHLGDMLTPNNSTIYPNWDAVNKHLDDFVGRFRKVNRECFICIGNHDGLESNFVNEFYTYGSMEKFNENYVVREGIAPWYYKDYEKIKTRVAFLAEPCRDLIEEGQVNVYQINQNQMQWIADTVFNVEDGWNVLFMCHIHPYSTWGTDGRAIFEGLTNAFCEHTTYQYSDWGINVDFTTKPHSKVIAFICGHTHADAVITDNSVFSDYNLDYPIICIASSNLQVGGNSEQGYTNPTRNYYSVSEDLWDTMVYRPDLGKIYMVRFGAGEDREIDV